MPRNIEQIAKHCHEANRLYCRSLGDFSQPSWEDAPEWQRKSAVAGVEHALANPAAPPSASHDSWLKEKRRDGWKYGPVKDPSKKEHPCFVPYEQLPPEQKAKDALFLAVVRFHEQAAKLAPGDRVLFNVGRVVTPGTIASLNAAGDMATIRRDGDGTEFFCTVDSLRLPVSSEAARG